MIVMLMRLRFFKYVYFNIRLVYEGKTFIWGIISTAFIILMKNFKIPQKKTTHCVILNLEGFQFQSLTQRLTYIMFADIRIINEQI